MSENGARGYILLDALVGIALCSLVLIAVQISLVGAASLSARLDALKQEKSALWNAQLAIIASVERARFVEPGAGFAEGQGKQIKFARALGNPETVTGYRLHSGQEGLLDLVMVLEPSPNRIVERSILVGLKLAHLRVYDEKFAIQPPDQPPLFGISVRKRADQTELELLAPLPIMAEVACIARPFEQRCLR